MRHINDIDPSWHPMKMKVTIAFKSDEMKRLILGSKKTGSLIDFISLTCDSNKSSYKRKHFV